MKDIGRAVDEHYLIQKRLKEGARFAVDEGNDDNVTSGGVNQAKGLGFTRVCEPLTLEVHSPSCSGCVTRSGGKQSVCGGLAGFLQLAIGAVI